MGQRFYGLHAQKNCIHCLLFCLTRGEQIEFENGACRGTLLKKHASTSTLPEHDVATSSSQTRAFHQQQKPTTSHMHGLKPNPPAKLITPSSKPKDRLHGFLRQCVFLALQTLMSNVNSYRREICETSEHDATRVCSYPSSF